MQASPPLHRRPTPELGTAERCVKTPSPYPQKRPLASEHMFACEQNKIRETVWTEALILSTLTCVYASK